MSKFCKRIPQFYASTIALYSIMCYNLITACNEVDRCLRLGVYAKYQTFRTIIVSSLTALISQASVKRVSIDQNVSKVQ